MPLMSYLLQPVRFFTDSTEIQHQGTKDFRHMHR